MNWTVPVIKCLELDYHVLFDFMAIVDVTYNLTTVLYFFVVEISHMVWKKSACSVLLLIISQTHSNNNNS